VGGLDALPKPAGGAGLLDDKNGWERAVVGMVVDAPSSTSPVPAPPPPWPPPGAAAVTPPLSSPSPDPTAWVGTRIMKREGRGGLRSVGELGHPPRRAPQRAGAMGNTAGGGGVCHTTFVAERDGFEGAKDGTGAWRECVVGVGGAQAGVLEADRSLSGLLLPLAHAV